MRWAELFGLCALLLLVPLAAGAQTAWAWGDNRYGQLGDGTTAASATPVTVSLLPASSGAIAVAAGGGHSLALMRDGTVWAWGSDLHGQLGIGTGADSSLPVPVPGLAGAIAIAAGREHSLALRRDGTVWAWGSNSAGQLGDGSRSDSPLPVQVWTSSGPLNGVTAVAAGGDHSLALRRDGTVWAWGSDSAGQLGDGRQGDGSDVAVRAKGLKDVDAVAAGREHSLALTKDGAVLAWGSNSAGQLGNGTFSDSSLPVRVLEVAGATVIAAGGEHSLAIGGGGTLWAWGSNGAGQLFLGSAGSTRVPVPAPALRGVTAAAGGGDFSFALMTDGTAWVSGGSFQGWPGKGADGGSDLRVQVLGLPRATALAAGGRHFLAIVEGCPAVTLSPTSLPGGTAGTAYSQVISASGATSPYTFAVTAGALPAGLGLNGSSGVLSGTPASVGSYPFTVTATDASGGAGSLPCTGSQAYTLTIGCPAISLSPATLPSGTVGAAYAQAIGASGGTAPYTFAVSSGSLPPGLTLNGSTGVLSGTPATVGSYPFTVTATDSSGGVGALGCPGSQAYTLVIVPFACPAITLSPASLVSGAVGAAYGQTITAGGGTAPYAFAVTGGSLPAGLVLNGSTGVLSGTPTATGSYTFALTSTDARGCPGSQNYTVSITCPPVALSPGSLPNATVGAAYGQAVTGGGGTPPYTFSVTGGSLPAGLVLNGSTGVLSGTTVTTGSSSFTITAVDAFGCTGSQAFTLAVVCPAIALSPAALPNATVAVAYGQSITASGGTLPYSFAVTGGSLPAGFSLGAATGSLAGTPAATGNFSFTVVATDAHGCWGAKSYTLAITTCTYPPVWTPTASLAAARQGHTATLLLTGKVLVAGGNGSSNPASALASSELYNPATGTWSPTGSMVAARGSQKAALLSSGKILVAGGLDGSGSPLASAEIYDPVAGTWSTAAPMAAARYNHTMTLLPNGKILVAGGQGNGGPLASAQVYDPGTGAWSATASMASARYNHTATLLPNGKVLVAGGSGSSSFFASAQLYDPVSGTWSATASMTSARSGHTATLLSSGKVLVAGGVGTGLLASAEIYDPAAGTWSPTGPMITARFYHSETLLLNGKVLVAGGSGGSGFLASAELYDPAAGTWSSGGTMASTREFHTATRLPSGKVLVAGGWKGSLGLSGAELFDPAPCYPTITVWPASLPVSTVAASYSQRITATGGVEPYAFEVLEGSLPDGLALESATGELAGAPSSVGIYAFTVVARAVADGGWAGGRSYFLTVVNPVLITSIKKGVPFKLTVKGSNLQNGIEVFIGGDEAPWPDVAWKSSTKVVLGGGKALKLKVPKGVPTQLTFVNPDGGTETTTWSR